ncbi:MAG: sensor histidine kinase, partial [Burkholderiaceae bacterium]|nr:sensor histidine kinase [Burkholderiaceae bacterium]
MTSTRPSNRRASRPLRPLSNARSANATAGLKNLHQLIQLRWIAVVGQLLTIETTHYILGMPLPMREMLSIVGCMAIFNVVSLVRWRTRRSVHDVEIFIGLLIDVAALTAQLYLSGGISNPFV